MSNNQRFPSRRESGHDRRMGFWGYTWLAARRVGADFWSSLDKAAWQGAVLFGIGLVIRYVVSGREAAMSDLWDYTLYGVAAVVVWLLLKICWYLVLTPWRLWRDERKAADELRSQLGLKAEGPDFSRYEGVNAVTLSEAAALWAGEEPSKRPGPNVQPTMLRIRDAAERHGATMKNANVAFVAAANDIAARGSTKAIGGSTRVTRAQLVELAEIMGERPAYLFPAEDPNTAPTEPAAPASPAGPKVPNYEHWDGHDVLFLSQAASLWEGEVPDPNNLTLIGKAALRLDRLFADYQAGKLVADESYVKPADVSETPYVVQVSRADLRMYAFKQGLKRPPFLFPEDRPVGNMVPAEMADGETKRLAGLVRSISEAALNWRFVTPSDPDDPYRRNYADLKGSAHLIWVHPGMNQARRDFLHACGILGDAEFQDDPPSQKVYWRMGAQDAERRLLAPLMGDG